MQSRINNVKPILFLRVCMKCTFYTESCFRNNTCLGRGFHGRSHRGGGGLDFAVDHDLIFKKDLY